MENKKVKLQNKKITASYIYKQKKLFFGKNNMVNLFSEQQNREIKLPPPYVTNL